MPRNKNPEETIQKILDASLKLFCEKGYEQTTILDIVAEMEASRGAFYHHFKSKEEVLHALLESKSDMEEQVKVYHDPNLSGLEKIRYLIVFSLNDDQGDSESIQLTQIMLDLLKEPKVLAEHVKDLQKVSGLQELVEAGIQDGSIEPQDSKSLSELIMLLLNFWLLPTIYPVSDEAYEEKVLTIKKVLDGVGCPLIDEEGLKTLRNLANKYTT